MRDLVNFASLGTEHLIRLAEDFVRALPSVTRDPPRSQREEGWISLISEVASRAETSSSFSQDGPALAETFRQVRFFPTKTRLVFEVCIWLWLGHAVHPSQ